METIFSSDLAMRIVDRLVGEGMTGNTGPLGFYPWVTTFEVTVILPLAG